jgi:urea transport system ATP-binding protein
VRRLPDARRSRPSEDPMNAATVTQSPQVTQSLLYLNGVSVTFDGFRAINNLSLELAPGEMRAIIGPNGAGKTTMMDVVTGKTRPQAGEVYFDGKVDLTRLDEAAIAGLGIGRKFQKPTVFESHTVELALAGGRGTFHAIFGKRNGTTQKRIDEILDTIHLAALRNVRAAYLSHGQKQWLEIGMLLAQEPKLLLVDEPAAGMTDAETEATAMLLKRIAHEKSVIVVEHDMAFVREIAQRITVMHLGQVLAEGSVTEIEQNPKVKEAYLGSRAIS